LSHSHRLLGFFGSILVPLQLHFPVADLFLVIVSFFLLPLLPRIKPVIRTALRFFSTAGFWASLPPPPCAGGWSPFRFLALDKGPHNSPCHDRVFPPPSSEKTFSIPRVVTEEYLRLFCLPPANPLLRFQPINAAV